METLEWLMIATTNLTTNLTKHSSVASFIDYVSTNAVDSRAKILADMLLTFPNTTPNLASQFDPHACGEIGKTLPRKHSVNAILKGPMIHGLMFRKIINTMPYMIDYPQKQSPSKVGVLIFITQIKLAV